MVNSPARVVANLEIFKEFLLTREIEIVPEINEAIALIERQAARIVTLDLRTGVSASGFADAGDVAGTFRDAEGGGR